MSRWTMQDVQESRLVPFRGAADSDSGFGLSYYSRLTIHDSLFPADQREKTLQFLSATIASSLSSASRATSRSKRMTALKRAENSTSGFSVTARAGIQR